MQRLAPEKCQIKRRIREPKDNQRARDNDNMDENPLVYGNIFNFLNLDLGKSFLHQGSA